MNVGQLVALPELCVELPDVGPECGKPRGGWAICDASLDPSRLFRKLVDIVGERRVLRDHEFEEGDQGCFRVAEHTDEARWHVAHVAKRLMGLEDARGCDV